MKCIKCLNHNTIESFSDNELVCSNCGASFTLELLGFYPEGSDDRIECGEEYNKWLMDCKEGRFK